MVVASRGMLQCAALCASAALCQRLYLAIRSHSSTCDVVYLLHQPGSMKHAAQVHSHKLPIAGWELQVATSNICTRFACGMLHHACRSDTTSSCDGRPSGGRRSGTLNGVVHNSLSAAAAAAVSPNKGLQGAGSDGGGDGEEEAFGEEWDRPAQGYQGEDE
jgi:hypothetical protein